MSTHSDFHLQLNYKNEMYDVDLVQKEKSDSTGIGEIRIGDVAYTIVVREKKQSEAITTIFNWLSTSGSISSMDDLCKKMKDKGVSSSASLVTPKTHVVAISVLKSDTLEKSDETQAHLAKKDATPVVSTSTPAVAQAIEATGESSVPVRSAEQVAIDRIAVEKGLLPRLLVPGAPSGPMNIEERMKELGVPGISIAVINNGSVEWAKGYGELNNPDLLSQAASISKTVTAVTVLSLIEQLKAAGRPIDLDTDVGTILVKDKDKELWKSINPKGHKVTIRHLLSHTAGTTVSGFGGYLRTEEIDKEIKQLKERIQDLEKQLSTLKDESDAPALKDQIKLANERLKELQTASTRAHAEKPPVTVDDILAGKAGSAPVQVADAPSGHFQYSGGGTTILQKVVEVLTEKPFAQVVNEQVFKKLGMEKSTFYPKEELAIQGNELDSTPVPGRWHTYPELAAAGVWSTPSDLAKVAIGIQQSLKGEKGSILGPELAKEMIAKQNKDESGPQIGLGVFIEKGDSSTYFVHTGLNRGFQTILIANDQGQGVAIMTNSANGDALYEEVLKSVATVYKWPNAAVLPTLQPLMDPKEVVPTTLTATEWEKKFAGEYIFQDEKEKHSVTISQVGEKILAKIDEETPFEITPLGEMTACYRRFKQGPHDVLRFTKEADGKMSLNLYGGKHIRAE